MKNLVAAFTDHLKTALVICDQTQLKKKDSQIDHVLVLGMGGSGIGGSIAAQVAEQELKVPMLSCKDYTIPSFVSGNTLVIASSFSGNTEETLSALEEAGKKTDQIVCLTSGGKIKEIAKNKGYECIVIPGGMPPRAALGYSLPQLFNILAQKDLIEMDVQVTFKAGIQLLDSYSESIRAEAKNIAKKIHDKLPVIYSESGFEGVCIRFRQQINENSKKLCWHHTIPEMNHNELVGWKEKTENIAVLMLRNESDLNRNQKRMELSKGIFLEKNAEVIEITSKGTNKLERTLYLVHLCDWISVEVADINHTDPIEIEVIDYFKSELAKG